MGTLWTQTGDCWQPRPLAESGPVNIPGMVGAQLARFGTSHDGGIALLARDGVHARVNGLAVLGGLRELSHKDEILVGTTRLFFSAESTPEVVSFQKDTDARTPTCPICRGGIKDGDMAVRCPGCGRWHHEVEAAEDRPSKKCWTYSTSCRCCNHPTALTGEPVWTPAKEDYHG